MRRRMMMSKKSELPSEYVRLNYIENTDKQWINTNYRASADDKPISIEIDFQLTTLVGGDMVGAMTSSNTYPLALSVYGTIKKWMLYHYGDASVERVSVKFGTIDLDRHTMKYVFNEGVYFDGVLQSETINQSKMNSNCNLNLYLFASNRGDIVKTHKKMKFYNVKFGEPAGLVRNYVPCYRKADGVVGMYDLCGSICPLTNTPFYINAGTGEFVGG